jgi:hypothetical protein
MKETEKTGEEKGGMKQIMEITISLAFDSSILAEGAKIDQDKMTIDYDVRNISGLFRRGERREPAASNAAGKPMG